MPPFLPSFVLRDSWLFWRLGGSTKATNLAVRKLRFSRSEFPIKIVGFCSWNRALFWRPNGRFSIPLCRTGMQGDFTLQIQSKSDTFSTSKLLSVSGDVQLLWNRTCSRRAVLSFPRQSVGNARGGPHTYINCDPILSFLGACESWFQQRFLLHKGEKNSCHFGSEKVAILDDPEIWSFLVVIQCLFWNVWFAETAGVSAMRRDGK